MVVQAKAQGQFTITDLTDISDLYLQYCMAADTYTTAAAIAAKTTWTSPEVNWFTLTTDTTVVSNKRYYRLSNGNYYIVTPVGSENPSTSGWYEDSSYPTWQSGYQIWIREVRIKEGIELPEYGTPYLDKAVNQINTKIKKIWSNSIGSYMASGIGNNEVDTSNSSTYGFNSKITTTGISFNYNDYKAIELDGTIPALKFYKPSTTSQGILLAQFGENTTIGQTSGDNYNINITNSAIDLRYNTDVLNRINNAGMAIYNANKYQIAKFGQETILGTITPNNFYTKVNSSGITIYHTVDDNAVPVWNSSNSCYEYPDLISVSYAQFGNTSRIGYEDRAHITIDSTSYKQYGVDGNNDLFISLEDLRDPDFLVANIVETFTDRSSSFLDLLFEISTVSSSGMLTTYHLPQVTKNGVTLTYDTDFSISSDSKRRLIFTDLISSADIIEVNYFTNDKMAKSFTLGKRNETAISGPYSFVIGYNNKATGFLSYAEGSSTTASGESSHAEGYNATASGSVSHAEGYYSTASGSYSHAEGHHATASGSYSHAEGYNATASSSVSHAEGYNATASGTYSHAEGASTTASGYASHTEGISTTTSRYASHAEGNWTTASGSYSHAEGNYTLASGYGHGSHAEGSYTTANGDASHAEGKYTTASGDYSHAQNYSTIAAKSSQTVLGTCNEEDTSTTTTHPSGTTAYGNYAVIIGNGSSDTKRSNALTVDWNGNINSAGSYYGVTPWAVYSAGTPNLKSVSNRTWYWVTSFSGYVAAARTNDTNVFDKVNAGLKIKRDGAYLVSLWIHFNGTSGDRLYARVARCVGGDVSNIGASTSSTYVTLNPTWAEVHIQQMIACLENDTLCPQVARDASPTAAGGSFRFGNLLMNVTYLGSNTKIIDL